MNLFGWKSRRAAARPVLARGWWSGWTGEDRVPVDYAGRVRAAFEQNPLAQRAVKLVMQGVAEADLEGDAGAVALVAARSGGQALLETVALHLMLHGNAYVQILEGADGGVGELYALRPERIAVEVDAGGWPAAYIYRVGRETTRIAAEDAAGRCAIVHLRSANPLDDHYGLGCLSAASGAVALHNAAARWNRALLDNAARPSGALVYDAGEKGATLTGPQFERLQEQMAAGFQGAGNAGRPLLLEGGLRWQPLSLSPAEMDFGALKDGAARDIACAFGVPPMLLGVPGDATYANYREAMKGLWRHTILPLAGTILTGVSQGLASWGVAAGLRVALDKVPALAEDRSALWAMAAGADFLSVEEKRGLVGV